MASRKLVTEEKEEARGEGRPTCSSPQLSGEDSALVSRFEDLEKHLCQLEDSIRGLLRCPNCGGKLEKARRTSAFLCSQCGFATGQEEEEW